MMANSYSSQKPWLPYFIAGIGILLSFLAWYVFRHDLQSYLNLIIEVKTYLPWVSLFFGLGLSILIAMNIHITQVARQRTLILDKINEDLKKEIGERKSAEATQQKLEIALLQGQKLQAIGTLAGGIAHDFNNILYAIIGYVEMAREDAERDNSIYINLGKVMDAAHRGQELVSRILAFSRRQHHEFDVINVKSTIEAALSLLRPTIPASVTVHFAPTSDVAVLGDQTQIHQVLVNIITNAVDAMEGEGNITIEMSHLPADSPLLNQFPDAIPQNYCKIVISDSGHGMDQSTMERIFDPFFTTKEVGKGTGLGLSIVHSIIKEHQGEISVDSHLGRGTTFIILLPEYSA